MKELISRKFPEMKVRLEARQGRRGHKVLVEVLLFLLVFLITNTIESIPLSIVTVVLFFTDGEIIELVRSVYEVNLSDGFGAFIDKVLEVTEALTSKLALPMLFLTAVVIVGVLIYCTKIERRPTSSLGMRKGGAVPEYLFGLLFGFIIFSAAVGFCAATGSISLSLAKRNLPMLPLFFIGYMIQGFSEELMCRGFLMMSLSRANSLVKAVLANSLVFAALHLANPGIGLIAVVNLFLFGVFASVYFLKRGNIWGIAALHSVWNFVQGNFFGIKVSGVANSATLLDTELKGGLLKLINGGNFGLEGGLGVTLVLLCGIAIITFIMPAKKSETAFLQ